MDYRSITDCRALLDRREVSARDLATGYLARIDEHNPALNAVITVTEALALEQADAADARIARGDAGPLTGIPFLHKDIFLTDGIRTTCGSRMLDNFVAPFDATVTQALAAHGMVMLGKSNMDEFAMGSSNETSFYGPCRNPWNPEYVPGGSSGGSASAVAGGMAPVATATDTGGSIRLPAAFCGVTGLKPTYGRVSRYGMVAFASSLDQGGPIAHSAEDCAQLMNAMAGFDPLDSTSLDLPAEDFTRLLGDSLEGLRIGVPEEFFADTLDAATGSVLEEALRELEKLGATRHAVSLPRLKASIPTYYVIAPAEASSNLARYDGVRYGYRCADPADIGDLITRSRSEGFGAEVKRRILIGTYVLSAGYYDAYYAKAQRVRRMIADDFARAFDSVDVLAGPTAPSSAFRLGARTDDPVEMYLTDIYTASVNLAGLPALSAPAGFVSGMPVGLQLIGRSLEEARLLGAAHRFQQATDWHRRMPDGPR